jgi:flagellar hook-length control protein FliK
VSAGTVVVTSTEGTGDMPSLEPAAGADGSEDGAPSFSEVLSLSSPDRPDPSGTSSPTASSGRHDASALTDPAATVNPEESAPEPVRSYGRRGHHQAEPSKSGERHSRNASSAAAPTAGPSGTTARPSPSSPGLTQPETGGVGPEQSAAAELPLASLPAATPSAGGLAPTAATVSATGVTGATAATAATGVTAIAVTDDGPPPPSAHLLEGLDQSNEASLTSETSDSAASNGAGSAAARPDTPGDGSDPDGIPGHPTPAVRAPEVAAVSAAMRASGDRTAPSGLSALHVGSEPVQVAGTASAVTASVPSAMGMGASAAGPVSTDEATDLAEFPDGAAGTAASTLDVGDLAASISRPLAAGNGDYSVQVSLHPPELGEVRALLSLQGDVLHVTLTPEHASGFEALSDAMPALHEQLAGGGVEVNVTLGQPGDAQGEEGRGPANSAPSPQVPSDDATSALAPSSFPTNAAGPGRIHLVL